MKIYIQTNKATTNIFGLHTQPRKTFDPPDACVIPYAIKAVYFALSYQNLADYFKDDISRWIILYFFARQHPLKIVVIKAKSWKIWFCFCGKNAFFISWRSRLLTYLCFKICIFIFSLFDISVIGTIFANCKVSSYLCCSDRLLAFCFPRKIRYQK